MLIHLRRHLVRSLFATSAGEVPRNRALLRLTTLQSDHVVVIFIVGACAWVFLIERLWILCRMIRGKQLLLVRCLKVGRALLV